MDTWLNGTEGARAEDIHGGKKKKKMPFKNTSLKSHVTFAPSIIQE